MWSVDGIAGKDARTLVRRDGKPWISVRRSGVHGYGLFAERDFPKGTIVGQYEGTVCGVFKSQDDAIAFGVRLHPSRTMLLVVHLPEGGFQLIDGASGGPPFMQFVNDPRGTGRRANMNMTKYGAMKTCCAVPRGTELLWRYGSSYWSSSR
jgi:hypothetical protein